MMTALARSTVALPLGALTIIVLLYPLVFTSGYGIGLGITIGAMVVCTVGYVLLVGLAEQLALGQTAFCMVGGYGSAILALRYGVDPLLAMLLSMLLAIAGAFVIGWPFLKLRGFILAMASIALLLVAFYVVQSGAGWTGGAMGLSGIPRLSLLGWRLGDDRSFFYFVWAVVLLAVLLGLNIDRSRIGRALRAIAASEAAAGSVGIGIVRHKLQMFVVSAGLASLTGSLTVHYVGIVEPGIFNFNFSLALLTAAVIGGLTSIWGAVVGTCLVVLLREAVRATALPLLDDLFMGLLTVVFLLGLPDGLVGGLRRLRRSGRPVARDLCGGTDADRVLLALPPRSPAAAGRGPLLCVENVSRSFGSIAAVKDVSLSVERGSITALIGPNGAGKTTLFALISGHQPIDGGHVRLEGRSIDELLPSSIARLGIARTFQNLLLFESMSVIENVMCGAVRRSRAGLFAIALRLPKAAAEERASRAAARRCLAFVGLDGFAEANPATLPFGHQRLLEIARALALEPALLIMDEPASGLNDTETEALAHLILRIRALGITVLLVEHDIRLVMGLADHVVVMDQGEKIAEGPPETVRADARVIAAYLGS